MSELHDVFSVQRLIARFANSFDRKDWQGLAGCLASTLYTDYSALRGTPPETMARERFVELRRSGLRALQTHHLAGNLEIELDRDRCQVMVSMAIFRRSETGAAFDTHCIYDLGVQRTADGWVIDSVVQHVLWNDGDERLHGGVAKA